MAISREQNHLFPEWFSGRVRPPGCPSWEGVSGHDWGCREGVMALVQGVGWGCHIRGCSGSRTNPKNHKNFHCYFTAEKPTRVTAEV